MLVEVCANPNAVVGPDGRVPVVYRGLDDCRVVPTNIQSVEKDGETTYVVEESVMRAAVERRWCINVDVIREGPAKRNVLVQAWDGRKAWISRGELLKDFIVRRAVFNQSAKTFARDEELICIRVEKRSEKAIRSRVYLLDSHDHDQEWLARTLWLPLSLVQAVDSKIAAPRWALRKLAVQRFELRDETRLKIATPDGDVLLTY